MHVSSTYYGFCGTDVMLDTPLDGGMRNLICKRWLSPVSAPQQSDSASWLRFGEYPSQLLSFAGVFYHSGQILSVFSDADALS